jgi:hypothetical protein
MLIGTGITSLLATLGAAHSCKRDSLVTQETLAAMRRTKTMTVHREQK